MSSEPVDLVSRGRSGLISNVFGAVGVRIVRTAAFVLLARLLEPADFGLVALAAVVTTLLSQLVSAGLTDYLIQVRELRRELLDSALLFSLAVGAVLAAALALTAPAAADALGQPRLAGVLVALAPLFLLVGASSVPLALMTRGMRFTNLVLAYGVAAVVSSGLAVVLVLLGAGVWGLVAQTLTEAAVVCVWVWIASGYRPGRHWSRSALAEMLSFGGRLVTMNYLSILSTRMDNLLIGIFLGPVALGFYSVAYKFLEQAQDVLLTSVRRVLLPIFSRLKEDPTRLAALWTRIMRLQLLLTIPLFGAAALAAGPLVSLLFGPQWADAAPIMTVLALVGPFIAFINLSQVAAVAEGRVGAGLRYSAVTALVIVSSFGVVIAAGGGILAVAVSYVVARAVLAPLSITMLRGHYTPTFRRLGRQLAPVLLGGAVALAGAFAVGLLLVGTAAVLQATAVVVTAVLLQLLASLVLSPSLRADLVAVVQRRSMPAT